MQDLQSVDFGTYIYLDIYLKPQVFSSFHVLESKENFSDYIELYANNSSFTETKKVFFLCTML